MAIQRYSWHLVDKIDEREAAKQWGCYDAAFQAINAKTPCRQSFREPEYLATLGDPDFTKLVVWKTDTEDICAGAMGTYDLNKIPWVNPEFFECRFPDLIGRLMYVPTIWVVPKDRGAGLLRVFAEGCLRLLDVRHSLAIAFDHSLTQIPWLPKVVPNITGLKPLGTLSDGELDHQVYWLMRR
jgi:hypothetical protein